MHMDFNLTKEHLDIQKAAREFARGEFDPELVLEYDGNQQFPTALWKKASEFGFTGVHYPEEYGGQGLGLFENALIVEAFCRQDSGMGIALALSDFGSELILAHGNRDQKKKVLLAAAQGKALLTVGLLEDGYALSPFKTFAREEERGYVVQGTKSFVTLGDQAQNIVLVCQTGLDDPTAQSLFLLEREMPGFESCSMGETLGMRMVPVSRISLNSLLVSRDHLIAEKDQGYSLIRDFLNAMRVECGAMAVGLAQGALDLALDYSKKRGQFGKSIATFDQIKNKLADMLIGTEMARLIIYKGALSLDQGKPDYKVILMSKAVGVNTACEVTNHGVQILGGYGYMTEGQMEHFYRDAKALDLFVESGHTERDMLVEQAVGRDKGSGLGG
jgi:alkylation response protein AidB-like acyl-CoA dehydrogenase